MRKAQPSAIPIGLGHGAFLDCASSNDIDIPDSVSVIQGSEFSGCTCLSNIYTPKSVKTVGCKAFSDCTNLSQVDIPESVGEIGFEAFADYTDLSKNCFNGGLRFDFEYDVFRNVTASVYLPSDYWHYYDKGTSKNSILSRRWIFCCNLKS